MPVNSVEGLARRVLRGDVLPETELFDVGTGEWVPAAESPVVRFILDECRRDGSEVPGDWAGGLPDEDRRAKADLDLREAPEPPVDPLELRLTARPPDAVDAPEVLPDPPAHGTPRNRSPTDWSNRSAGERREEPWVTPSSEGGLLPEEPQGTGPSDERAAESVRSGSPEPVETHSSIQPAGGLRSPRRAGGWRLVAGIAVAAVVVLFLWVGTRSGSDTSDVSPVTGAPTEVVVPAGLEEVAEQAVARVSGRMLAVADSVRTVHGLERTPPDGWLTGPYLADATEFPQMPAYWEAYRDFLGDLGSIDQAQLRSALSDVGGSAPSNRQADLAAYLQARFQSAAPERVRLFDQLSAVTDGALALHGFLVEETESLRYTPALGSSQVPRDPVLEVESESQELLAELGAHLDRLFDDLDRSRGGGAPTMSGIGNDLFRGFGLF